MAEQLGVSSEQAAKEREVVRSTLRAPFDAVDTFLLNDGIQKVGGAVIVDGGLVERLWPSLEKEVRKQEIAKVAAEVRSKVVVEEAGVAERYKRRFRGVVKRLVDGGVVDSDLAALAGFIVRPSSVDIGKLEAANAYILPVPARHYLDTMRKNRADELLGRGHDFKLPVKENAELVGIRLTERGVDNQTKLLRALLKDVNLTSEEYGEWAETLLLSHEYGHALLRAVELKAMKTRGIKEESDVYKVKNEVWEEITKQHPVGGQKGGSLDLPGVSLDERVAYGLELDVLGSLLEEKGVDSAQIRQIKENYFKVEYRAVKSSLRQIVGKGERKGLTLKDLLVAHNIIAVNAKDAKVRKNQLGIFLGYCYPLSRKELKEVFKYG